jgi:hypothetical protein
MQRRIKLTDGTAVIRRRLVAQGRRLVLHDLRRAPDTRDDRALAHEHQERYLGRILGCQPDTYFKTQAVRAHNGWDQARENRLFTALHRHRIAVAEGASRPTYPAETGYSGTPSGVAGGFGLRKKAGGAARGEPGYRGQ